MKWHPTEDSDQVVCRFAVEPRLDVVASREANDEVYKDVTVCHMKVAGSQDTICHRMDGDRAEEIIKRCLTAWRAFQGEAEPVDGTPLEQLKGMPPEKAAAWRLQGIHTVEQVAELSDSVLDRLGMGARSWQRKAKQQVGSANRQLQGEAHAGSTEPQKRGPGRPRKAEQAA